MTRPPHSNDLDTCEQFPAATNSKTCGFQKNSWLKNAAFPPCKGETMNYHHSYTDRIVLNPAQEDNGLLQ